MSSDELICLASALMLPNWRFEATEGFWLVVAPRSMKMSRSCTAHGEATLSMCSPFTLSP
jgi:hypothetical protein